MQKGKIRQRQNFYQAMMPQGTLRIRETMVNKEVLDYSSETM